MIEEALRQILVAAATSAGERVYPLVLPANPTSPSIAYTRISTRRTYSLTGPSQLAWPRFQFTAWALTYDVAKTLANAIRAAFDGYNATVGGVVIQRMLSDNELDMYEPRSGFYGVPVDFIVAHTE